MPTTKATRSPTGTRGKKRSNARAGGASTPRRAKTPRRAAAKRGGARGGRVANTLSAIAGSASAVMNSVNRERFTSGVAQLKDGLSSAAQVGPKALKQASAKVATATRDLVKWGKKHPVKSAAAATAMLAASGLIYAAMRPGGPLAASTRGTTARKAR
ncbi:MAG TPA: hypothetical protein VEL07_21440 [Planctomycetota bacterium]|nr:hypothetical protein [Planctomycetota bacterium]